MSKVKDVEEINKLLYRLLKKPLGLSSNCMGFKLEVSMGNLPQVTETKLIEYDEYDKDIQETTREVSKVETENE